MKKIMVILMACGLFTAVPAFADHSKGTGVADQEATHTHQSAECAKECDLLLKDCAMEIDTIQQRIDRIKTAIKNEGATTYTVEELKTLNKKLKETNEIMRALNKPGR